MVIEQAAIAGALNPEIVSNVANGRQAADYIAKRLDVLSDETERGWVGEATEDGGLQFSREQRGVKENWLIDAKLIGSPMPCGLIARPATCRTSMRGPPS